MNSNTSNNNQSYTKIFKLLGLLLLLYVLSAVVVYLRLGSFREQVTVQILEQQTLLIGLSETTARNGADAITESIIKDCSVGDRTEFDNLLGSLDKGLPRADLLNLERLFDNCGGFYAKRKALMVSRLDRELDVYVDYVEQLNALTTVDIDKDYRVEGWKQLVEQEQKQSELFSTLVEQQDAIITRLIDGTKADSEAMKTILQEARETQEMLLMINRQTAETRSTLIPL